MNKNLYRIVFNKARGMLMVVAENIAAQGKSDIKATSGDIEHSSQKHALQIKPICFAAKIVVGVMTLAIPLAQAQIVADPNAPGNQRPTILPTANGLPQVNIQTPSAAGVSRNTYKQFDVQSQGAILNNSRTSVQTQTGGWVQGNPWLVGGAARVILNEVNSSNPSQLNGYVEVAGQRAEVIIANPAGIQVNGGGFINANKVTLTTGTATINPANGGSLDYYRIPKGTISIDGLGLDTRTADYTDILARSVEVNAGIWANRLKVVTGANQVSTQGTDYPGDVSQGVTPIAGTGPVPQFSLDVAALGGMYARHIYLVGTEAGMGVRNQGAIGANGGNLVLLSNGMLTNEGAIQAAAANGAGGNLRIETTGQISNLGADVIISAQGNADIKTQTSLLNTDGTIVSGGAMSIDSAALSNAGGLIQAGGNLAINTNQHTLDNTRAASHVSGAGGIVSQGAITIQSGDLKNDAGYIGSVGAINIDAAQVSNTDDGQIVSQADIGIAGTGIDNTAGINQLKNGQIQAFGNITLDVGSGTIDNTAALIRGAKDIALTAGSLRNNDTSDDDYGIEGKNVSINAATIDNTEGAIRSDELISIKSSGTIDNTQGLISSAAFVEIQDDAAQKSLVVTNTGGTVIAGEKLTVDAATATGDGKLLSVKDLSLTLSGDFTNSGKLQAGESLTANVANLENTATGEIAAFATTLNADEELLNRGVIDGVKTRINANTVTNIGTGRIYGDHLSIGAVTLRNDTETLNSVRKDAVIAARDRLDIGVETLVNRDHALIFSAGTGTHALNIGGSLDADGFAVGRATTVTNGSATIESMGDLNIAATQLNNLNLHFTTSLEVVAGPVRLLYIQPSGSGAKLLSSNFVWENWSRAGQYRFRTSPPPNNNGILGQSPVPRVGEQDCVGEDEDTEVCTRIAGADYLSNNPAWTYFNIPAPAVEPVAPSLTAPTPPNPADASSCTQGAGYNASACTAYNDALAAYDINKQTYDNAWSSYQTAHATWESETDAKYTQLDNTIASYNQQFAGSLIRAWTQFDVTRTEKETKVATSDPGQILSGGTMRLTGDDLINDKSRIIAGGVLAGDLVNLRNIEAEGVHVVNETGTSQYTYSDWRGGLKRYHQRRWDWAIGYHPADEVTTITLAVTQKMEGVAPTGTGTQVTVRTAADGTQAAAVGSAANAVGTLPTSLPSNSLFQQNPNPLAKYLIETDSRFTNMKQWMGSDYMLSALGSDPTIVQKRLGDGFYEQKLIREQVAELTGRRFLDSYASDEAQYQALMDAGVTVAKQWNLVPGIALSQSQVAQLTSDIVWLVSQEVTLADGSKQIVLVPQVYLQVRDGDLSSGGALLAGAAVDLKLGGDLTNAGTIAGRALTQITAQNINNLGGLLTGDRVGLQARDDINVIGGQVLAKDTLVASAGNDINVISSTQSGKNESGQSSFTRTSIDRVAGLYVTGASDGQGTLVMTSGQDVNIAGAIVANYAKNGATIVQAANDINLGAIETSVQENNVRTAENFLKQGSTQDVGSKIIGSGTIALQAGQDINATAATIDAGDALALLANRDINITAGEKSSNFSEARQHKTSGFMSKKTVTKRTNSDQTGVVGSSIGGETVLVQAARDVSVQASSVIGDQDVVIVAGNNVSVEAMQTTQASSSFQETKKSGLFSGGLSVTYGKQEQSADQKTIRTAAAGSTIGSIGGDVAITAGNQYQQTGSDVIAPTGDISIAAKQVDIVAAIDTAESESQQRFRQSGITVALSAPVISAMQAVAQSSEAMSQTKDSRMQALGAANTAKAAYDTYQAAAAAAATGSTGINISITVGGSQSESTRQESGTSVAGSTVQAGNNVSITATGAGDASNINVIGSDIKAGNNATLKADGEINLLAAQNTFEQQSKSSSSSGAVGVALAFGGDGVALGVTASASVGRGNADGRDVQNINTHVVAGNKATIDSGGDTNMKGGVVTADQVTANVGGNLNVESLQDTSVFKSKDQNLGGSVTVGFGFSGSVSAGQSKVDADFASVVEQSGIQAGDGGFNVNVAGNTDLKGAVIASTEKAVTDNKNTLKTGTLTQSNIENHDEFKASSFSIGLSGGSSSSDTKPKNTGLVPEATSEANPPPTPPVATTSGDKGLHVATVTGGSGANAIGFGSESGSAKGISQSGVSGGTLIITDSDAQQSKTGQTADEVVASINRDVVTGQQSGTLTKQWDAEELKKEVQAQAQITAAFGSAASGLLGDYAAGKILEAQSLRNQAEDLNNELTDVQRAQLKADAAAIDSAWKEGGTARVAMHAVIGGLTGGIGGALGAGASSLSVPYIAAEINSKDLSDTTKTALIATASTALGATVGNGFPGAGAAFNEVINNCLAHECLSIKWDKEDPGYHEYHAVPSGILCTTAEPGCMDAVKKQLSCNSAPGQPQCASPSETKSYNLTGDNQITQYLSPNGMVVINGTTEGKHMLDDGYVMRWIGVDDQGAVRIYTYGEGVNKSWLGISADTMAQANTALGKAIFNRLGVQNQIEVRNALANQGR